MEQEEEGGTEREMGNIGRRNRGRREEQKGEEGTGRGGKNRGKAKMLI